MSNASSTDMDSRKVQESEAVEIFTGISQTLFALGVAGFRAFADAWESEILAHTDDSIDKVVQSLEKERETYDKTFGESLEKINKADFDAQAILFRNRAVYHKALDERIAVARLIPASKAYEVVAKAHGLPHRKPAGNTTDDLTDTVWKIERYKQVRYALVYADKVDYRVSNGEYSDSVGVIAEDNYPNMYASLKSRSAIGVPHDIGYTDKATKNNKGIVARWKAAEVDFDNWHLALGLNSKTSNGVNGMTLLVGETPESWLEKNPDEPKEESTK